MTNDEINKCVARIVEPKPGNPPSVFDCVNESPGGVWWYDVMQDTGWQPLDFCTDIAAAWKCVEWAGAKGAKYTASNYDIDKEKPWAVGFYLPGDIACRSAATAPLAICLAFIAAFGGSND